MNDTVGMNTSDEIKEEKFYDAEMDEEESNCEDEFINPRSVTCFYQSKEFRGSLLVLISAFMFSIMTLLVNTAGEKGIPSFQMMVIRCVVQMIYSATACVFIGVNPFGTRGNRFLPFLRGVFGPLSTGALYYGATKIAMTDASVLSFTTPIWTLLIARVVLKERITLINSLAITIGFIGVIFVGQPQLLLHLLKNNHLDSNLSTTIDTLYDDVSYHNEYEPGSTGYLITFFICIAGAVCSSIVYVIIKKTGSSVHFQVLVFYYGLVGAPLSLVQLFVFEGFPVLPPDLESYVLLGLISVSACVAQTTFNAGGQMIAATKTAVYRSTDVIFVLLWQVTLLHEIPSSWSLVGMLLVCICTIMMAFSKSEIANTRKDDENIEYEMVSLSDPCEGNQDNDIFTECSDGEERTDL